MPELEDLRDLAESFLDEMFEAERARDFTAWSARWHESDLGGVSEEVFLKDLKQMDKVLGSYRDRDYFGHIEGVSRESDPENAPKSWRFVWRSNFEKNAALTIVGIHEVDGVWRPYMNLCSIS